MALFSPRRLFVALLAIPVLFLVFLYLGSPTSELFSVATSDQPKLPDEIFGLLHFVTSPDEAGRVFVSDDGAVTPDMPVDMSWYARGSIAKARGPRPGPAMSKGWETRLQILRDEYPLVVFSKSYCPYSKRAKRLLEVYDLSPRPKIIEVDLRADSSEIKAILTRLTQHSTFPNIVLHGRSLGGSDDLIRLHREDRLRQVLAQGGVEAGQTTDGGQDMVV